jgi:hypothetical protein
MLSSSASYWSALLQRKIYGETEREESVGKEKGKEGNGACRMRCKGRKKKKTLMQHKRRKVVLFYSE